MRPTIWSPAQREMYSAELKKEDLLTVKRLVKQKAPRLEKNLEKCSQVMLGMKRECETWQLLSDVTSLAAAAMAVFSDMETFLEDFPEFEGRDTVLDFYFGLRDFLNVYELLDDHYRIYAENVGVTSFKVRLFCVDPSANLSLCMSQGNSTILFSATMLPDPVLQDTALRKRGRLRGLCGLALRGRKTSSHGCDGRQQPLLQAQRERIPEGGGSISGRWFSLRAATT